MKITQRRLSNPLIAIALLISPLSLPAPAQAQQARPTLNYEQSLDAVVRAMEGGRHINAVPILQNALQIDRNEPLAVLALATLYLHTGTTGKASREFARYKLLDPASPLGDWGLALCSLAMGANADAIKRFSALPADFGPSAPLLRDYARLMNGETAAVKAAYANVTENEADAAKLEIAAFAALRGGDGPRAETLLKALLSRPEMIPLIEDRASLLLFEPQLPLQGGAAAPVSSLSLSEPRTGSVPFSGRVTLNPPGALPPGVAYVAYTVNGGVYSATTNYPPFTTEWNTSRHPNGLYTLKIAAHDSNQRVLKEETRTITLSNPNAPASGNLLTPELRDKLRTRLAVLLMPRPCRKAAHFALAERAVQREDTEKALQHIEAVVAIDPTFHNARQSLRQFNMVVQGPSEGIWKGQTTEKLVALTFDDGPNPAPNRTPALLDAMKTADAKGTFFVVGVRAEESPDLLRRMRDEGHEIGNHSFTHPNLTYLTTTAVERELCRTSYVVRQATGKRPRFYRPPGGNFNSAVVEAARTMGMAGAYWTVDAIKHEMTKNPAPLIKYVLETVRPGSIILLHNAPDNTIQAVPEIVRGLRAKGYEIVTMSELVKRTRPILKGQVSQSKRTFSAE